MICSLYDSAMDGYAVACADLKAEGPWTLRVSQRAVASYAGKWVTTVV